VASTAAGRHAVTAWCRGAPVAQDTVELEPGVAREVALTPDVPVGGVFRITVLDPRGLPRAERLVSVTPPHRLDLEVRPSADGVSPGERVKVEVTARDEQGRPARAVLGVSVVDDTVLSLAKDEDTPDLPLHFLLGLEVEELERVELYSRGPGAARAVDRLLGIQGWRRFAWRDPRAFLAAQPGSGPRVLLASGSDRPQRVDNLERAQATLAAARRELDDRLLAAAAVAGLALAVAGALAAAVLGLRRRRPALWVPGLAVSGAVLLIPFLLPFALNDARERVRLGDVVDASLVAPPAPPAPGAQTPEVLRYVLDFSVGAPAPLPDPDFHRLHFFARGEAQGQAIDELEAVEEARAEWKQRPELERALRQVDGRFEDRKNLRFLALAREYAHKAQRAPDGARRDFTEVLYWNPNLVTGADGRAAFELETCDSVTTFSVAVEANDARGALAAAAGSFRNRVPFFLEPKLPQALSAGDRLLLPVVIANDTGAAADVSVELASGADVLRLATAGRQSVPVAAGARARVLYELRAAQGSGVAALTLSGRGPGAFEDRSVRSVPVTPRGFPIELARGGVLEKQDETAFRLPESFDRTTLDGSLRLYPSVVATLVDGLDALLREPSGCFEQASSTNYPNVLVLACLSERGTADQQVARRARDLLRLGYAKLAGYECSKRGYEWFGADPGHEALSAYGLLEFTDMARVHAVDPAMIARTRDWLLARRDGRGGFQRNARALDSFGGASPEVTDAYIVWALTEADPAIDIAVELAALEESARKTDDPYLLALGARALANRRLPAAKTLLDRLAGLQREDGGFAARGPSITSSTGPNLEVETAGLATLAFLTDPARLPNAERAVRFLAARRERGGSFGATQATILALKALVEHGRLARRAATDHAFTITVNGRALPVRHVAAGAVGAVVFDDGLRDALVPGENRIGLATTGAEPISWALALRTHATLPADDAGAPLRITATLDRAAAREGETVRLEVSLVNPGDEGVPMPLVRLGLPAGLEPRPDQLEELRKQGAVDFYETRPREVTCYFRGLAAKSEKRLALDLVAAIPGEFEGPATSAYPYYRDDRKAWAAPLRVRVEPAVR
jgi:hypothetical protein